MIRVLICEDARSDRELLARMIGSDDEISVAGFAESGDEAIALLETLEPDVLTMDINLPDRSGLSVIDEAMAVHPLPILVVSDQAGRSEVAMEALAAGAVEVHMKPALNHEDDFARASKEITSLIKIVARAKVIRHLRGRQEASRRIPQETPDGEAEDAEAATGEGALSSLRSSLPPAEVRSSLPPDLRTSVPPLPLPPVEIVAIAASTGGPQALREVLSKLPADLDAPVVIVQHIASGFTEGLVAWLSGAVQLSVKLADDGEELVSGVVYIAPERRHMKVRGGRAALEGDDPVGGHCPSADVLFESVSEAYGDRAMAVILTGMGRDGAAGMRAIRERSGATLVQDEESCAVFGMPKAAIDLGAADSVLPLGKLAAAITARARVGVRRDG